jgi:putative MFS transporter
MGWASGMARVAGIITPTLGGILFAVSLLSALSLWAAAFVLGGIVVFLLGVETKRRALSDTVSGPLED